MFNLFSIFLLLIAVLQIVEAIEIWLKPCNLRYTAEIICLNRHGPITIGTAKHASVFGESGTTGYVNIDTDLRKCDYQSPKVKVRIKNLDHPESLWLTKRDHPYESMEIMIWKTEILARKSAVVLGFNIAVSAHKIFNLQQSSSNFGVFKFPLVGYELEIVCGYMHADGMAQYYLIGSGMQKDIENFIHIRIFEMESLAFCSRGKIGLVIHQSDRETTKYIELTTKIFGEYFEFDIDVDKETVRPIPQAESDNECVVCLDGQREMAFRPCRHAIACRECSSKIIKDKNECPICRKQIKEAFGIYFSPSLNIPSGTSSSITRQTESNNECVFCLKGQVSREIAFRPCGHICACRKCSKSINKCPICRQQIKEDFLIFYS